MNSALPTQPARWFGATERAVRAGLFLLVLTLRVIASTTPEIPASATAARQELHTFLERWNDAMAAQDTSTIRASYVADDRLRWFEDGALRYRSAEEILNALLQFPPGTRVLTTLSEIEAERLAPNLIHGSAHFRTRVMMPGQTFEYAGVFTLVIERADAGWRFLRGHTSTIRARPAR